MDANIGNVVSMMPTNLRQQKMVKFGKTDSTQNSSYFSLSILALIMRLYSLRVERSELRVYYLGLKYSPDEAQYTCGVHRQSFWVVSHGPMDK